MKRDHDLTVWVMMITFTIAFICLLWGAATGSEFCLISSMIAAIVCVSILLSMKGKISIEKESIGQSA